MPTLKEVGAFGQQNAPLASDGHKLSIESTRCFAPEQFHSLIQLMLTHGYSVANIRDILGSNFRRIYASAARRRASDGARTQ